MMTVDGVPNVRVCTEPIREGAVVEGQNVRWSLDFDLMSVTDKIGGPFTPGRLLLPHVHPAARGSGRCTRSSCAAPPGSGSSTSTPGTPAATTPSTARARVLVVGGGQAGRAAAALAAAKAGPGVVLVDEDARLARLAARRRRGARARRARSGSGRAGLVPVDAGTILYRFRAERIVVATGAIEQPLVFPGTTSSA